MRILLGKSVAFVIVPLFLSIPVPQKSEVAENDRILFAVWGPQQGKPPRAFMLDPIARIKGTTFADPLPEGRTEKRLRTISRKSILYQAELIRSFSGGVNLVPSPSRRRMRSVAKVRRPPQRRQNQLHLDLMHWQPPLSRELRLTTIGAVSLPKSKDRRLLGWRAIT